MARNNAGQLYYQGFAGLGAGIGRGLEQLNEQQQKREELRKQQEDALKKTQGKAKSLGETLKMLEQSSPAFQGSYDMFLKAQSELSPTALAAYVADKEEGVKRLIDAGVKEQERQKLAMELQDLQQRMAREQAARANFGKVMSPVNPAHEAVMGGARFGQIPSATPRPPTLNEQLQRAAGAGADPNATAQIMNALVNAYEAQRPKIKETSLPPGFRPKLTGDGIEPIPGGPPDIQAQKDAAEAEKEKQRAAAKAASMRSSLAFTLRNVDDALALVRSGAGGTVAGIPPARYVGAMLGQSDAKTLNSKYNAIRGALRLEKLAELKELSNTGGSGLGQLSDAEGRALESAIAELDASNDEKVQEDNLRMIREHLLKAGGVLSPSKAKDILNEFGL